MTGRVFVSKKCNIRKKTCIKSKGKVETPDKIATFQLKEQLKNLQNKKILTFTLKLLMLT